MLDQINCCIHPCLIKNLRKIIFSLLTFVLHLFSFSSFSQSYQWAHGFCGPNYDAQGNSIATDAQGNVYVTGVFGDSIDFDPGIGNGTLVPAPFAFNTFISKYDSSGNFVWVKGLLGNVEAEKIVVNSTGIYLTGHFFLNIDFDPGPGSAVLNSIGGWNGDEDIFIAHYDLNGNYLWAKSMGGLNEEKALDMELDNNSNIYITGYFKDTVDLDPGVGVAEFISNGFQDSFFAKYDVNGNYVWAYDLCDSNCAAYNSLIELDNINNAIYISGAFSGTLDFDRKAGVFKISDNNYSIRYISKYDTSGSFAWAGYISAASGINISDISLDKSCNGDFLICGSLWGVTDFDLTNGVYSVIPPFNYYQIYFAKYYPNGNLIWAKNMGDANGSDGGRRIMTDNNSNVYLTGFFTNTVDFDPDGGNNNLSSNGNFDAFFAKYNNAGNYIWSRSIGGLYDDRPTSITLDATGSIYLTGFFTNTMDADPDTGVSVLSPAQSQNIFIGKYANTFTSLFELEKDTRSSLFVYPNPANEIITIINREKSIFSQSKIIITNMIGEVIFQELIPFATQQLNVNVKLWSPGLYHVTAVKNSGLLSTRFIKN